MKYATGGDPTLLLWSPPLEFMKSVVTPTCFFVPIAARDGGVLAAIPLGFLSDELLLDASVDGYDGVVGPSKEFEALLLEEDDAGFVVDTDFVKKFLVVDLDDSVFDDLHEFDPVTNSTTPVVPFEDTMPAAIPKVTDSVTAILEWVDSVTTGRIHFYSARDEPPKAGPPKKAAAKKVTNAALVEQIAALSAQVSLLQQQQQQSVAGVVGAQQSSVTPVQGQLPGGHFVGRLPSLTSGLGPLQATSKAAASLAGPPPRTRAQAAGPAAAAPVEIADARDITLEVPQETDPLLHALSSQSTALTALVAHLAGGGDAMQDLSTGGGGSLSLSSRGVARRERMQNDLASRSSNYFLQIQQQLYKRMNPSGLVPKTQEDLLASGVSMTGYLERYGGYKNARDAGLALWVAGHAMDCAARDDFQGTKEYLALLCGALEQSALDGSWSLAWVLTLLEDPPAMLFADRMQPVVAHGRPFSPLIPPSWAATSLAYLKEIEMLVTRKSEIKGKAAVAKGSKEEPDKEQSPSPKRRPKFPRKPKDAAAHKEQ